MMSVPTRIISVLKHLFRGLIILRYLDFFCMVLSKNYLGELFLILTGSLDCDDMEVNIQVIFVPL